MSVALQRRAVIGGLAAACLGPAPAFSRPDQQLDVAALQGLGASSTVLEFYRLRGWAPAWSSDDAGALSLALADAIRHGLEADQFLKPSASAATAARELALTSAALAYADALAHGLANPSRVHRIFTLGRNRTDVIAGLGSALGQGNLKSWLSSLPPKEPAYSALSEAYLATRSQARGPQPPPVPSGPLIRPGAEDKRVPAVVAALLRKGWPTPPTVTDTLSYAPGVVESVKLFQDSEGLKVDGVIGPDTLFALNAGPADRARQIALNLERWRWLDRATPSTRIDVNTAAATLAYYRDGRLVHRTRTVVGHPRNETPSLGVSFDRLVVNPPWRVPASIARREILPKGPAYLRRNNMYVRNGRVIQRPGPQAALGLVKFDMQNPYAIYLHDTPAKALFEGNDRHRSHGCVRVEDAVGFARRLAAERGRAEAFEQALSSGRTRVVSLGEDIPVRLLYRTAFVSNGQVRFAPDHYGLDDELARAVGMAAASTRPLHRHYATIPFGP